MKQQIVMDMIDECIEIKNEYDSIERYKRSRLWKKLIAKLEDIACYLIDNFPGRKEIEALMVGELSDLCDDYHSIMKLGIKPSPLTDNAFPGYITRHLLRTLKMPFIQTLSWKKHAKSYTIFAMADHSPNMIARKILGLNIYP